MKTARTDLPSAGRVSLPAVPRSLRSLVRTSLRALAVSPPLYIDALFGHPWTWIPPHREDSEFRILDPLSTRRAIEYLSDVAVPGFARDSWNWLPPGVDPMVWRPTRVFFHPDHRGRYRQSREDQWFFINGVATNEAVAVMNASFLARLFHRPLTVVLNSTNSLVVDLAECAVGKSLEIMTEPARVAFPLIAEAVADPACRRVVLICHSQGTIIASNVLEALVSRAFRRKLYGALSLRKVAGGIHLPESLDERLDLRKLEIYAFANCADTMEHVPGLASRSSRAPVPWIESFGNERDVVARLGMLAPAARLRGIRIDGPIFCRPGAWGHLLNEHYLFAIADHLAAPEEVADPYPRLAGEHSVSRPRLYDYYAGGPASPG